MRNILKYFWGLTVVKPNQPVGESTVRPKVKSGTAAGSTLFIHHNFRNIQNHTDFKIQVQYKAIFIGHEWEGHDNSSREFIIATTLGLALTLSMIKAINVSTFIIWKPIIFYIPLREKLKTKCRRKCLRNGGLKVRLNGQDSDVEVEVGLDRCPGWRPTEVRG